MRPVPGFLVAILVLTVLGGCLAPGNDSPAEQDLTLREVWFSHVQGPAEAVQEIERLGRLDGVRVEAIGSSAEGRPLHAVTIGDGPFVLWVMGRLHGNEPSGMQAILLIMDLLTASDIELPDDAPMVLHDFLTHRETLLERITFVFVPVGNPDGAEAYQRGNSMGVDLNRDFFAFSQPETQVIREAFWDIAPDGCLDLHNIGPSENDFEAYGPTGPLMEAETEALMLRDSWFAVHEIDAQGGRASGMNEDYRAPAPADDHVWPEAYHPGTHDLFCSVRGAPGWTPEGSIVSGGNGATDPVFAWSARLHAVTVAASAFHWAGLYDAVDPVVVKGAGRGSSAIMELEVPAAAAGDALRVQAVWRPAGPTYADHTLLPILVSVTDPAGNVETTPASPYRWSTTFLFSAAREGVYRVAVDAGVLAPFVYEARAYGGAQSSPLASVARVAEGLRVTAASDAPDSVFVALTDVAAAGAWDDATFSLNPVVVRELTGSVHERAVAEWHLVLEPGSEVLITVEGLGDSSPGPFRFTATSGDRLFMGVATEPRVAR